MKKWLIIVLPALVVLGLFLRSQSEKIDEPRTKTSGIIKPVESSFSESNPDPPERVKDVQGTIAVAPPPPVTSKSPVIESETLARKKLESDIELTLYDVFDVNSFLDAAIEFLDNPISPNINLEYEDTYVRAFRVLTGQEDIQAHFCFVTGDHERNGKTLKNYEFRLEMPPLQKNFFLNGVLRREFNLHVNLARDQEGNIDQIILLANVPVDLSGNKKLGINAYQGNYKTGAIYSWVLDGSVKLVCKSFGIVNGSSVQPHQFPGGLESLNGNLSLDMAKLEKLNKMFSKIIKEVEERK